MAHLIPSDLTEAMLSDPSRAELETLSILKRLLPSDYMVFHGVHWSREYKSNTAYGEIDLVVVNRSGECLVIEQKNGSLIETQSGLVKRYGRTEKSVPEQIHRSIDNIRDKYKRLHGRQAGLRIDYLLYCPDYRVKNINAAGLDQSRIVDGGSAADLPGRVRELLGPGMENDPEGEKVLAFFRQSFDVVPDIHAHIRRGEASFTRLSGGLARVLDNIEMAPLRLRVSGVPGSGKTIVARRFFERALEAGRRPLFVCFNRPLAEKVRATCPAGGLIQTWYGLCAKFLEARGETIDYAAMTSDPDFWLKIQDRVVAAKMTKDWQFDTLIVDEGQDFQAEWFDMLQLFLEENADILWLEDRDQSLRRVNPPDLQGFVGYRATTNYRSPESIARFILREPDFEFECGNDLPGLGVGLHDCEKPEDQPGIVRRVIAELRGKGFDYSNIVLLTLRGVSNSVFSDRDRVGNVSLRRFTGEYDLFGNQVLTDGQVRFDSIYRFKGQQAPAVIVVDVPRASERSTGDWARFYVAVTRATVRLDLVGPFS